MCSRELTVFLRVAIRGGGAVHMYICPEDHVVEGVIEGRLAVDPFVVVPQRGCSFQALHVEGPATKMATGAGTHNTALLHRAKDMANQTGSFYYRSQAVTGMIMILR